MRMQPGMIGLGRMGANMARRLMKGGHDCVVHDVNPKSVNELVEDGAIGAESLGDLVSRLSRPRAVRLMVPAAAVDRELEMPVPLLETGDAVIDGGNSYYRDDVRRGAELKSRGIHYVDVGTSGGVAGLERGYCLMIGAALFGRFDSCGEADYADRLLSAMRKQFGGHDEKKG